MAGEPHKFIRDLSRCKLKIHITGFDGFTRHLRVPRRLFILGEGDPSLSLDRLQSKRAV